MIVVNEETALLVVTQSDHAVLAAEILALCRFPELLDHPRRDALIRATREHDNGWRETDAAPPVDGESGRPHTLTTLRDEERRRLWSRGCERFRDDDPYVALLICEHALTLHRDLAERADWMDWTERIVELRGEMLETTGLDEPSVAADYSLLRFADACSLALCSRSGEIFHYGATTAHSSGTTIRLDPLPLAGSTTFHFDCRRIPRRAYRDTVDLGTELAAARWQRDEVRLTGAAG